MDIGGSASVSGVRGWTPISMGPLSWIYAAPEYVTLSGLNVARIEDRSGNGNYVDQSAPPSQPLWEPTGWSSRKPSVAFSAQSLNNNSTSLFAFLNGSDKAFSVLTTCQVTSYTSVNTIVSWDDSPTNTARCELTLDTSQLIGFKREDDAAAVKTGTSASPAVGTGHVRLAWVFNGTTMDAYVEGALALAGSDGDVGAMTMTRLRIGDGIEAGADSLTGRLVELVVVGRAVSVYEISRYQAYSIAEWES